MRNVFRYGGLVASIVLIVLGIGAVVIGANGRSEVRSDLRQEAIVGTPDMTPGAIAKEAKAAGLTNVALPTCSVANKAVNDGASAKCFASYMRIHALEATGGKTYAQMPHYQGLHGTATNDATQAAMSPAGTPIDNPARAVWINETALSTALNTSYFAQSVALFSIVMGAALLLTGIGFLLLCTGLLSGTAAASVRQRRTSGVAKPVVPAAS